MPKYTFSPEDRRKGGQATASKYNMRERGKQGLQALADKYFDGNIKKAGKALSMTGNVAADAFPANRAFTNERFFKLPAAYLNKVWSRVHNRFVEAGYDVDEWSF